MPFPPRFLDHYRKADRIMLGLIWLMFAFAVGLAFWHDTFMQALLVGGGTSLLLTLLYRAIGGSRAVLAHARRRRAAHAVAGFWRRGLRERHRAAKRDCYEEQRLSQEPRRLRS